MPKISVIVPVYNVEPYIHRCLDSILAQTFADFELILVDDGSPDHCDAICDEYAQKDRRIHVIHQENGGLSAARNAGMDWLFANSESEWITFVDSDDWVHNQYLELLYQSVMQYSTHISQCGYCKTEGVVNTKPIENKMLCVSPEEQYSQWYAAFAWGKLYHKSCFTSLRYPVGLLFEDVAIWYKILFSLDKIAIIDEPLYYYFQRQDSIIGSSWTPAKLSQIDAWEEQLEFARGYGSKRVLQAVLGRFYWVFRNQCEEIKTSDKISEEEREEYYVTLIKKIRALLPQYRTELKEMNFLQRYRSLAFPSMGRLYQTYERIWEKLKK